MIIINCTGCSKKKHTEAFALYPDGRRYKQCKECRQRHRELWKINKDNYRDKRKKYYKENREKHRSRNFKNSILKKYGISVELYEKMFNDQKGRCAICEIKFTSSHIRDDVNKNPCVDHCHQTNKVRALLCRKCNISLAYIESGFIDKANKYLRVHEMKDKEPS